MNSSHPHNSLFRSILLLASLPMRKLGHRNDKVFSQVHTVTSDGWWDQNPGSLVQALNRYTLPARLPYLAQHQDQAFDEEAGLGVRVGSPCKGLYLAWESGIKISFFYPRPRRVALHKSAPSVGLNPLSICRAGQSSTLLHSRPLKGLISKPQSLREQRVLDPSSTPLCQVTRAPPLPIAGLAAVGNTAFPQGKRETETQSWGKKERERVIAFSPGGSVLCLQASSPCSPFPSPSPLSVIFLQVPSLPHTPAWAFPTL